MSMSALLSPVQEDDIWRVWLRNIGWKVAPEFLNSDEELIPTYWTELPPEPNMSNGC